MESLIFLEETSNPLVSHANTSRISNMDKIMTPMEIEKMIGDKVGKIIIHAYMPYRLHGI